MTDTSPVRPTNPAIVAAANFDLYRVCGAARTWRTRDGGHIWWASVEAALAVGMLGDFAAPELIDGVWVQRMDLSESGLDWYLQQTA
jgi:hypothetical protein